MADPYIDQVTTLLHFDGASGAQTFANQSPVSFASSGSVALSTAQQKFGATSGHFQGGYLQADINAAGLQLHAGDFTVELWLLVDATPLGGVLVTNQYQNSVLPFALGFANTASTFGGGANLCFSRFTGSAWEPGITTTWQPAINVWHHIAVTRDANTIRLFADGVLLGSYSVADLPTATGNLRIGHRWDTYGVPAFLGYIDELRITKGIARYTANFTPDAAAFDNPTPPNSRALFGLGRRNCEPPNALLAQSSAYNRAGVLGWRNIYQGGAGRVAGTVEYTPNIPVHRKVRLIEQATGLVVREAWSHPVTGAYSFDYVATDCKYTVLSYDYTGAYRAVVADGLIPEVMP